MLRYLNFFKFEEHCVTLSMSRTISGAHWWWLPFKMAMSAWSNTLWVKVRTTHWPPMMGSHLLVQPSNCVTTMLPSTFVNCRETVEIFDNLIKETFISFKKNKYTHTTDKSGSIRSSRNSPGWKGGRNNLQSHSKTQGISWILEKFMLLTAVEQSERIGQYHAHLDPFTHFAELDFQTIRERKRLTIFPCTCSCATRTDESWV